MSDSLSGSIAPKVSTHDKVVLDSLIRDLDNSMNDLRRSESRNMSMAEHIVDLRRSMNCIRSMAEHAIEEPDCPDKEDHWRGIADFCKVLDKDPDSYADLAQKKGALLHYIRLLDKASEKKIAKIMKNIKSIIREIKDIEDYKPLY